MLLYIIRHGERDFSIPGADKLSETGMIQAEALSKRLFDAKIDKIFSSPKQRAIQTATPTCELLGLECNIEKWTHEIGKENRTSFPDGKPKIINTLQNTYFRENLNQDLGYNNAYECPGFSDSQMKSAVEYIESNGNKFLERLGYKYENGIYRILEKNEEKVALFCHSAFARAWISVLLHIPINIMWASFDYNFTGVTVIEFKNNENGITAPKCLCYSDLSHIYSDRLKMEYNNKIEI